MSRFSSLVHQKWCLLLPLGLMVSSSIQQNKKELESKEMPQRCLDSKGHILIFSNIGSHIPYRSFLRACWHRCVKLEEILSYTISSNIIYLPQNALSIKPKEFFSSGRKDDSVNIFGHVCCTLHFELSVQVQGKAFLGLGGFTEKNAV